MAVSSAFGTATNSLRATANARSRAPAVLEVHGISQRDQPGVEPPVPLDEPHRAVGRGVVHDDVPEAA